MCPGWIIKAVNGIPVTKTTPPERLTLNLAGQQVQFKCYQSQWEGRKSGNPAYNER